MKAFAIIIMALTMIASCAEDKPINSGEIREISCTRNIVIGTDSSIIIIEKETGKTLNVVDRKR